MMMGLQWVKGWRFGLLVLLVTLPLLGAGVAGAQDAVDIYQQVVPEMTTLECAKCHRQAFEALRDGGGLHKQPCRDCHQKFHTFTPGLAWEQRVPACSSCHDFPHGETINACLECHTNAHAPIEGLIAVDKLADLCSLCHQSQQDVLAQSDNAHAGQACVDCHQGPRHGQSPQCQACHAEAHTEFVDNQGCMACHPAHAPSPIRYGKKVPDLLCGGCHAEQMQVRQASQNKHKSLACIVCHPSEHGNSSACEHCHGNGPHNQLLLQNFTSCSECHGDAHQLKL